VDFVSWLKEHKLFKFKQKLNININYRKLDQIHSFGFWTPKRDFQCSAPPFALDQYIAFMQDLTYK